MRGLFTSTIDDRLRWIYLELKMLTILVHWTRTVGYHSDMEIMMKFLRYHTITNNIARNVSEYYCNLHVKWAIPKKHIVIDYLCNIIIALRKLFAKGAHCPYFSFYWKISSTRKDFKICIDLTENLPQNIKPRNWFDSSKETDLIHL